MKKIILFILTLAITLSLVSCSEEFEPVPSTEEEAKTVLTLSFEGKSYDVAYELYRAFFLTYKDRVDGGDSSVWSGPEAALYVEEINEMILDSVADIYAAFHLCEKIGVDLDSKKYKDQINAFINQSLDNIIALKKQEAKENNIELELSRDEAYEIYLSRMKDDYLNYSVTILLYKYQLALLAIDEYYRGDFDPDDPSTYEEKGALEYTENDVRSFYESADSVKLIYFCKNVEYTTEQKIVELRNKMANATRSQMINMIIGASSAGGPSEVERGMVIGKYSLDNYYFGELTEIAFSMSYGDLSNVITLFDGNDDYYYVIYCDQKSSTHFETNYADVAYSYVSNEIGKIKESAKNGLENGCSYTYAYSSIVHSEIRM